VTINRRQANITGLLVRDLYYPSSQNLIKRALHEITVVKRILIFFSYRLILSNAPNGTSLHHLTPNGQWSMVYCFI